MALVFLLLPVAGVNAAEDLQITTTSLPDATEGKTYFTQLQASGGAAPYTWSTISTTYPSACCILGINGDGPTFNTQTAASVQGPAGTYSWSIQVTDSNGDVATKTIFLTIKAATPTLSIVTTSLPDAFVGLPYFAKIDFSV